MHVQLLNIGFMKRVDGTYINQELGLVVEVVDNEHVLVDTALGKQKVTLRELEDAIVAGGFGEF
jgi:hypothetical protein